MERFAPDQLVLRCPADRADDQSTEVPACVDALPHAVGRARTPAREFDRGHGLARPGERDRSEAHQSPVASCVRERVPGVRLPRPLELAESRPGRDPYVETVAG